MKKLSGSGSFIHSIRFRLVMWFTIILALVMITFSAFIYYNQARDIRGDALYHLDRKLGDIEAALLGSPKPSTILQPSDVFILFDEDGKVLVNQGVESSNDVVTLIQHAQVA